ncbi:LysR family transcriptional regulator [Aquamicrobium sp. LC103]|uniref:LysR family transcriptional regulator n=1 Tax=Aquamicrobium sp. LC103 TaxID=1120658 RepID=UPI000B0B5A62|nr:LysR family transcriptional regulator [Aquamicrobium sp. LC103]
MDIGEPSRAETIRSETDAFADSRTSMPPNLRHIRLLIACADKGSLTAAAASLGVTQPAASQALKRLESQFGTVLIERDGMRLTAAGDIVVRRSRRLCDFIRRACGQGLKSELPRIEARLTWSHLRAVSTFAENGSFSAAARMLGQSEPAVQGAARQAEAIMGMPLFDGAGRAISLNSRGLWAARWFGLALAEFGNGMDEIAEARGEYAGRVSIGTLPLTRTFLVPDVVATLARRHPQARFEVTEGSYEALLADLERGRIDILVGAMRADLPSKTLQQERLFDFELRVVGRADHPLVTNDGITTSDLAKFPWIVARRGTPSRETFRTMAASFQSPALESVETGSLNVIRGILLKSDHLALLSLHQIRYEMEAGFLAVLDHELPHSRRSVGATLRRHWLPTALQSEFLDVLREISRDLS